MSEHSVGRQYGARARGESILAALRAAGHDPERFEHDVLGPVEEFHSLGRSGTAVLAERAGVASGESVLDVGCGIGGPARYLTRTFGCRVSGVDLTAEFCEIARDLKPPHRIRRHDRHPPRRRARPPVPRRELRRGVVAARGDERRGQAGALPGTATGDPPRWPAGALRRGRRVR